MAKITTYKQLVKTFKFRDKKKSESPRAYISARGKAMGKEWRKIKKELEGSSKKKTTTKKKSALREKHLLRRRGLLRKKQHGKESEV